MSRENGALEGRESPLWEFLKSFDYSYGFRVAIGVALAWFVAFRLNTDKPYWAIMTVVIVTLPTQAKLVEKFIARLIGTLVGAIMVNIIAAIALTDQWLFVIYMGFWLSLCAYLASARSSFLTYCFALCGYTSAILGFSLSILPSSYLVFQITQARILEILIGLVTAFFISMLWPSYRERVAIKQQLRQQRQGVRSLYQLLLTPEVDKNHFNQQYHAVLTGLIDFRDLVVQDFLSLSTDREDNLTIYRYGHRLIKSMSGLLLLESMKREMMRLMPEATAQFLNEQRAWLLSAQPRELKLQSRPAVPDELLTMQKGRYFVSMVEKKLRSLLTTRVADEATLKLYTPSLRIYYSDRREALINGIRTFFSVMLGMAFWMGTQWETGYILLVLIGVICTLGATYPMINKLLTAALLLSLFFTLPIVYLLKYGILIKINHIVPAMMVLLPIYFLGAIFKVRSLLGFLVGYGFMLSSIFLIGFSNPMDYDFPTFANNGLSLVIAFVIILMLFNLIPPSSDARKLARIKGRIITLFNEHVNHQKALNDRVVRDYEAYLYSAIYQVRVIKESRGKAELLAYAFLTLSIIRQQNSLAAKEINWQLPKDLLDAIDQEALNEALQLTQYYGGLSADVSIATAYWSLESALKALIDFLENERGELSVAPAVPGS